MNSDVTMSLSIAQDNRRDLKCIWETGSAGTLGFQFSFLFLFNTGQLANKTINKYGNPGPIPPFLSPSLPTVLSSVFLSSFSLQLASGDGRPSLFSTRWSLQGGGEAPATLSLMNEVWFSSITTALDLIVIISLLSFNTK